MLRDLSIENYRLFRKFELDSIARVNLIVGENNSGKSSLLEAIYLLTGGNYSGPLAEVVSERSEFAQVWPVPYDRPGEQVEGYQVAHIFYGYQLKAKRAIKIESRSPTSSCLTISFTENSEEKPDLFEGLSIDDLVHSGNLAIRYTRQGLEPTKRTVKLLGALYPFLRPYPRNTFPADAIRVIAKFVDYGTLVRLWDNITLTPKEDQVVTALQILEPSVQRISFTSGHAGILLKLKGQDKPLPLSSMGDGMHHLLALTASLVNAENGTLLVDEIDTGLHHSALTDMWRLLLETAIRLNVQVFATTHSWDCVEAFKEAVCGIPDVGDDLGRLTRLRRRGEYIQPVSYSPDELAVAVQHAIEVR